MGKKQHNPYFDYPIVDQDTKCPICGRVLDDSADEHHLKPKTFGSRDREIHNKENLIRIHKVCHTKVHHTFSEKELLDFYHTVERLLSHPEIRKFVEWIKNKPIDYMIKHRDTNQRRNKRRR